MKRYRAVGGRGLAAVVAVGLFAAGCSGAAGSRAGGCNASGENRPGHGASSGTPSGATGAAPGTTAGTASSATTGTGRSEPAPLHDDFNGDGYSDVAIGAPGADLEGLKYNDTRELGTGYVAVLYGSAHGLRTSSRQILDQDEPGIPGTGERGDGYGSALAAADLDQDGYADLIVGTKGKNAVPSEESYFGVTFRGSLSVVWGGPHGLSGSAVLPSHAEAGDDIGEKIVAGDLNGDGAPDVATTVRRDHVRIMYGPFRHDGTPEGGVHDVQGPQLGHLDPDDPESGMNDLATGDVDGDGITDLVSVSDTERSKGVATAVSFWKGAPQGLCPGTPVEGMYASHENGDSVAVGDVNGDGYADIVANDYSLSPTQKRTDQLWGGMIIYVPGSRNGPDTGKIRTFNQDSPGVPGLAEERISNDGGSSLDDFGAGLSVGDIDGDGYADVSVGVDDKNHDRGSVVIMRGTAHGLTGTGAQTFDPNTPGVPGAAREEDYFGTLTKLVDTDDDHRADLLVTSEADQGDGADGGAVWVFGSTAHGVAPQGSFLVTAHTFGAPAQREAALGWDLDS